MLRMEMIVGSTTYRFASEDVDYGGYFWEARLHNSFDIQRAFSFTDKTGNRRRQIAIVLDNNDQLFNTIEDTYGILGKNVTLYFDDGNNLTKKITGSIVELSEFNLTISISISEEINIYFDQPFPDAQIAYDYYSDTGINDSWNVIPIVFGNVTRLKVAWVNKVAYRFMVCSGEIFKINKVYFDKYVMYDEATSTNGYQATPESNIIKVRIWKGAASETLSAYPGFAYIEFYDSVTDLPIEPLMTDGRVPEIYVDVSGVVNDARTACERNPARLLHKLLSNPITGINGWGLGIGQSSLNFMEAIGYCDMQGYVIDGVINKKSNASEAIDNLLRCMGGALVENAGNYQLIIDKAISVTSCAFDEAGEEGYNCNLSGWTIPPLDQQNNRLRLFYDLNAQTQKYDRRPDANEESPCQSAQLHNEAHALKVGKWNTATIEFDLIKDHYTAHKLAQFYFKRDLLQLKTVTLTTDNSVPNTLDVRQKITITSQKFGWSAKEFTISEIIKGQQGIQILAREYDSTVYDYVEDLTIPTEVRDLYGIYDIPAKPTALTVTTSTNVKADGSLQTVLNLSATKPDVSVVKILFYRFKTGDSGFSLFASSETGTKTFIWDREDGAYNIRAVSVNAYGVCSSLTPTIGVDSFYYGHPGAEATITITTGSGTVAPNIPNISDGKVLFKTIRLTVAQNATKNPDISGFFIYRNSTGTTPPDDLTQKVGEVAVDGVMNETFFWDESTDYNITYYYWTKAINKSGQLSSSYSSPMGPFTTYQIQTGDVVNNAITATKIGTNAIESGHISANAVTSNAIAANAVTATHIIAGTITTNHLNAAGISADCITAGNLSAANARVGGWCVNSTLIYGGTAGISSNDTCPAFWAGHATGASAGFRAYHNGYVIANNLWIQSTQGFTTTPLICIVNNTDSGSAYPVFCAHSASNRTIQITSTKNVAIFGETSTCFGVYGAAGSCAGVFGIATTAYGVCGVAGSSVGVYGYAAEIGVFGLGQGNYGVIGCSPSGNVGVYGHAINQGVYGNADTNYGVYGYAGGQYGGWFNSNTWPSLRADNGLSIYGDTCGNGNAYFLAYYVYTSDRKKKNSFTNITVLQRIKELEISAWKFNDYENWHIGPMEDDFQRVFPFLGNKVSLSSMAHVAFKGVQELDDKLESCIAKLAEKIVSLESKLKENTNGSEKTVIPK